MQTWRKRQNKNKGKIFMSLLLTAFILALALSFAVKTTSSAVKGYELEECKAWKEQAANYRLFTAARWQIEQCKHYDISLS